MWPNPQETADLDTFTKKSLKETFTFVQYSTKTHNHNNQP